MFRGYCKNGSVKYRMARGSLQNSRPEVLVLVAVVKLELYYFQERQDKNIQYLPRETVDGQNDRLAWRRSGY